MGEEPREGKGEKHLVWLVKHASRGKIASYWLPLTIYQINYLSLRFTAEKSRIARYEITMRLYGYT